MSQQIAARPLFPDRLRGLARLRAAPARVVPLVLQQVAEVAVRVGVPRIRRDRRAVGRLRALDILPLVLQQEAEAVVGASVPLRPRLGAKVGTNPRTSARLQAEAPEGLVRKGRERTSHVNLLQALTCSFASADLAHS